LRTIPTASMDAIGQPIFAEGKLNYGAPARVVRLVLMICRLSAS
jgi:hypothetical protein